MKLVFMLSKIEHLFIETFFVLSCFVSRTEHNGFAMRIEDIEIIANPESSAQSSLTRLGDES